MRDGIYRVWAKGPQQTSSGAVILNNGDLIAVNATFGFVGRYNVKGGKMIAEIRCRRLSVTVPPINLPALEEFHLTLEGPAKHEFASLTGTIRETPGFALPFEFAWLCEV